MLNHPDRGGDAAVWGELQKAYDILSDPQRRAAYDKAKVLEGSAEKQYAEGFAANEPEKRKGMSISQQVGRAGPPRPACVRRPTRARAPQCFAQVGEYKGDGKLAQTGMSMSHSSGFEAWMRNQKGLGKTGFYTAEDLSLRPQRRTQAPRCATGTRERPRRVDRARPR
jgi:trans-2-enoyl-CoA reductase